MKIASLLAGAVMLLSFFGGLLWLSSREIGWKEGIVVMLASITVTALLCFAVSLVVYGLTI